jgi:predicted nicotinamide N-methyase
LRNFILKQFGFESLIEQVFQKLGDVESVYITNDWAEGKESTFVDLVVVGDINKTFMNRLIEHAEKVIQKKIRVAVYDSDFDELELIKIPFIKLI